MKKLRYIPIAAALLLWHTGYAQDKADDKPNSNTAGAKYSKSIEIPKTDPTNTNEKYFEIAKNLDIFATLFKEVNTYYVDEVNPSDVMEQGIYSMLNNLDPYTVYYPEDKIEDYRTMTTGQYGGIGAQVITRNGKAVVTMPFEGYAAHKAGLQIGDEIIKIDEVNVQGKTQAELSQVMKGQADTDVTLTVKRFGTAEPVVLKMKREKIQINNVTYSGMVTADIGLIRLTDFTNNAAKEVKDALTTLKSQGAKKIILDLRGNPGGLLSEAINISNIFVPKGLEIVSTKGKVKEWNKKYTALNQPTDAEIPMAVLTSNTSASAAEIVSGVMQDYDRGVLIGQNTYGKGLVQATRSLSYNSKLKVTVAKYYIPSGRCIQAIDYTHRNADGSVGKISDSLRVAFKTKNGRVVYDGGGVKPDIELPREKYSPIALNLDLKGFVFDYANEYRAKHKQIADAKNFQLTDDEYQDFVKWLSNKDYDYTTKVEKAITDLEKTAKDEKYYDDIKTQIESLKTKLSHNKESDLQKSKAEIKEILEQEIVAHYYLDKGKIEATFDDDQEILEAIKVLNDKAKFDKILLGKK
jgi:carboxyl-terminal processing protease